MINVQLGPIFTLHYYNLPKYPLSKRLGLVPGAFAETYGWYRRWASSPVALWRACRDMRRWIVPRRRWRIEHWVMWRKPGSDSAIFDTVISVHHRRLAARIMVWVLNRTHPGHYDLRMQVGEARA